MWLRLFAQHDKHAGGASNMAGEARALITQDMLHMQDDRGRGKQESSVVQLSVPVLCCIAGRRINPQIAF